MKMWKLALMSMAISIVGTGCTVAIVCLVLKLFGVI